MGKGPLNPEARSASLVPARPGSIIGQGFWHFIGNRRVQVGASHTRLGTVVTVSAKQG